MIKIRSERQANYKAVFVNGKTIRMPIDPTKTITELHYPEFYDVALSNKCKTGQTLIKQPNGSRKNCFYCYASASLHGEYYKDVVKKIHDFFGPMTPNQRPTQWAIGGSGEPLEHPDFWKVCEAGKELGITANYTTNGILVTDTVVDNTIELAGGVAVTCHSHMNSFWRKAVDRFAKKNVRLNLHVILSDRQSIEEFQAIYKEYKSRVEYFVLLPYMNVGLAANHPRVIDFNYLEHAVDEIYTDGQIAFGANFYSFLLGKGKKYDVSLYPPEIMSKYLVLKEDFPKVYNNSFDLTEVPFSHENGCQLGLCRTIFSHAA